MKRKKRLITSVSIFLVVFLIGVFGFWGLGAPGTTILDSAYMTVITLSTHFPHLGGTISPPPPFEDVIFRLRGPS
jgi:hypothetical protein